MKKILIVEDVEFNRDLLTQLLEDDFELIAVSDGQAGIAAAEREQPDLILMDISMPVMSGMPDRRVMPIVLMPVPAPTTIQIQAIATTQTSAETRIKRSCRSTLSRAV